MVVKQDWREGGVGNYLMGTEFRLRRERSSGRWMVAMVAEQCELVALNCMPKND